MNEVEKQRDYYNRTAELYDSLHVRENDMATPRGHPLALEFMFAFIDMLKIRSVLDVGSGTGRAALEIQSRRPQIDIAGIEPSEGLRAVSIKKGLKPEQVLDGDAQALPFDDKSFDLVCAFGVLHHTPDSGKAVSEMLRVSRKAIFISDNNNWGQGRPSVRFAKQFLHAVGLWPLANYIQTRGKGYKESAEDGIYYSYSLFNDLPLIERACDATYLMGTGPHGKNLFRSASNLAVCGIKHRPPRT